MCFWYKRHYLSDYMVATRPENGQGKWNFYKVKEFHFESGKIWKRFEQQADVGFLKNQSFLHIILRNYQFIYITCDLLKAQYE